MNMAESNHSGPRRCKPLYGHITPRKTRRKPDDIGPYTTNSMKTSVYIRHGWEEFGRVSSLPGVERIFLRKCFPAGKGPSMDKA
jgi:hypothetical protein